MQQAKERLATTMLQQTNRGRLAVAYRSLRMFHEEVKKRRARQQAAYNLIGRGASTQVQRVALNTWLKFAAERRAMRFRLQAAQALLAASRTGSIRLVYSKWRKLMETRKAQRQRRSVAEMIFQRSVQGARMVAFRKLKLFAETQAEARRQKDASMRIAYSLAVQSSDKNRSRNAMNT